MDKIFQYKKIQNKYEYLIDIKEVVNLFKEVNLSILKKIVVFCIFKFFSNKYNIAK